MKLKYTYGCVCDSISVDGVESIDMDINDFREVVHQLVDNEQDSAVLQDLFTSCMESQGNYESSKKPCDCCGDTIITYTLEL